MKLLEQGAVLKRVRIDAELKREIARATENRQGAGRERSGGRRHGSRRRRRWGSPSRMGGWSTRTRSSSTTTLRAAAGRVNVEIATEHYSAKSIGAKAAAGFAVHGSNGRAVARVARSLGQDHSTGGGSGRGRDKGSIEL